MGLFIPFFSAGHPKLDSTVAILELLNRSGADYIEVGLPHSDALADGEVIQSSSFQALQNGMQIELLLRQIREFNVSSQIQAKLILFSYFNPILTYGLDKTCQHWKEAGGYALLIPDLPLEESEQIRLLCDKYDLKLIFLIAPTSTSERIQKICDLTDEFIYLVSVAGVTGEHAQFANNLKACLTEIKACGNKVVIGFGVSSPKQAKELMRMGADGVVVGSAFVKLFTESKFKEAEILAAQIKMAIDSASFTG
ncbi:MAG: tryptophan synthase subunit alpha [Candidatus Caenarcaniphilales bacterium]|nr:tryptophan synthase subunit alpha [Candidatus Caenarcaniphilales bacterium]